MTIANAKIFPYFLCHYCFHCRSATIVISVQNINEFTPQFEGLPYSLQVAENAAQGTSVGVIRASDKDGDKVTFTLAEGDTGEEKHTAMDWIRPFIFTNIQNQFTFKMRERERGIRGWGFGKKFISYLYTMSRCFCVYVCVLFFFFVDYFGIEKDSGRVFVKKQLESRTAFHFVAVATDDGAPTNRSLGVKVSDDI